MTDSDILGNEALYERLCVITAVLGKFVASASRPVTLAQLEKHTGRPARDLYRLCAMMRREGLLRQCPGLGDGWILACDASSLTLEDAFRVALMEQAARGRRSKAKLAASEEAPRREVDLLVTQAAIAINQSVLHHLRQFSLDRLKVAAAGVFSTHYAVPDAWARSRLSYA